MGGAGEGATGGKIVLARKGPLELEVEDWKRDTGPLSLAAKGAWIDILGALHTAPSRGVMTLPLQGWARLIGATVDQAVAVIRELVDMKVPDHSEDGQGNVTIKSRRMVREEMIRESNRLRKENERSRKCHSPVTVLSEESPCDMGVTEEKERFSPQEKEKIPPHTPPLKEKEIPPSSKKKKIPPDFQTSAAVREWAKSKGFPDPDLELEHFRDHHTTNVSRFADWDAAFRNWLRTARRFNAKANGKPHGKFDQIKQSMKDFVGEET